MSKKIIYSIVAILLFISGAIFERFELDNKSLNILKKAYDGGFRVFYSFTNTEKIFLDISNKEYEKILKSREEALKLGVLKDSMSRWVPAKIKMNDVSHEIKIRLKGAFPDHWSDPSKLSFKIKVNNDSMPINNLRRLNLQSPETLSFLYEWLLSKALEQEKLINLRLNYYELILNGNSLGVYALQDAISPESLQINNRKSGPIIGFSKDLYLDEITNAKKLNKLGILDSLNGLEDTFWRSKIEVVQMTEGQETNDLQQKYLKESINLLNSFRNGELKTSQVFDVNKLAKVMAIRASLGSSEFDYRDTKFYYNPDTSLLEPITKEVHVSLDLNFKDYYSWWIDSTKKFGPHYTNNTNFFIDLIYRDYNFYKLYLNELNNISKKQYFKNLIEKNNQEFSRNFKILKTNFPTKEIFSEEQIKITRARIQDLLNPVQGLNVNFLEYEKDILKLKISNLQRLPVEIIGIKLQDKSDINLKKSVILPGKKHLKRLKM